MHVRGMSGSESPKYRERFVTQQVKTSVKATLFRMVKFINSNTSFQRAMKLVMDHKDVPPQHHINFQRIYDTVLNEALNSKRSACKQLGGKIARKTITKFEKAGEDFITMDKGSKLRKASTDCKRKAFFWSFGTFLECVSGNSRWGGKKSLKLVLKAKDQDGSGRSHVITKSDKAFSLLIFENYIGKWKLQLQEPIPVNDADDAYDGKPKRIKGKYTVKSSGHCKYGGWNPNGIVWFNEVKQLAGGGRQSMPPSGEDGEGIAGILRAEI